jgi:hypothetical protein
MISSIDRAVTSHALDDGAPVGVTNVIDDEGQRLASEIREQGGALFLHHDVSEKRRGKWWSRRRSRSSAPYT